MSELPSAAPVSSAASPRPLAVTAQLGGIARRARCCLLAIACLSAAVAAHAQAMPEDYSLAPGFNGGKPYLDRFNGVGGTDYRGRFVVRVPDGMNGPKPDGDVLVVGEVPGYGQVANHFGFTNIGIVRYDRNGVRQPMHVSSNGFGGTSGAHPYVVTPNDEVTRRNGMTSLVAVSQVHNDHFYVLTNEHYSVPPAVSFMFVSRFHVSGTYRGRTEIMAERSDTMREDLFGIDMTLHHDGPNTSLMIVARQVYLWEGSVITGCDDDYGCGTLARVNLQADGTPVYDATFGLKPLRAASPQDNGDYYSFRPTAIASGPRGDLSPYIYVAGTHLNDGPTPRVKVKKYDSATNYLSQTKLVFRGAAGRAEKGARLLVREDNPGGYHHVYVTAQTEQQCAPGAGVAKISDTGALVQSFNDGGKLLFGGNDDTLDSQACAYAKFALPLGMAMDDDGRLAIAGQMSEDIDWNNTYTTGMLTVVDSRTGTLLDFGGHFARGPDNYPIGAAAFYSVVPTGNGSFTVAGDQRDADAGDRLMFTTARIAGEGLFADHFE